MTAHETLSHEAMVAWAELVFCDRRGWVPCEFADSDRAAAFRELVAAEMADEDQQQATIASEDGSSGRPPIVFAHLRLTGHGRRLWGAWS